MADSTDSDPEELKKAPGALHRRDLADQAGEVGHRLVAEGEAVREASARRPAA